MMCKTIDSGVNGLKDNMIKIAHRGNFSGPFPEMENRPDYIERAIEKYDAEIDLWLIDNKFFLGHDKPQYHIKYDWLLERRRKLWIHCKNIGAIQYLAKQKGDDMNYFGHSLDSFVITSAGYVISIGLLASDVKTIIVMPEVFGININGLAVGGVMTDYLQ